MSLQSVQEIIPKTLRFILALVLLEHFCKLCILCYFFFLNTHMKEEPTVSNRRTGVRLALKLKLVTFSVPASFTSRGRGDPIHAPLDSHTMILSHAVYRLVSLQPYGVETSRYQCFLQEKRCAVTPLLLYNFSRNCMYVF